MRLTFGDFVFDRDTREVIRGGRPLTISPKAFTLLDLLIECRPKAVSTADIRSRLWPDVHVSGANLANLVVELRSAMADDARKPRVIRTVARFGYAFIAPVGPEGSRVGPEPKSARGVAYRLIWGRREIALEPGDNLIGRDREAVVWIDDESVSRRHARITIGDRGASIEDLGSKNGTYVGGRRIREPTMLADRASVKIGPAVLKMQVLRHTGSTRATMTKDGSQ
jgi:DNA-binding winged helix-turn-helix (wHTH) protein